LYNFRVAIRLNDCVEEVFRPNPNESGVVELLVFPTGLLVEFAVKPFSINHLLNVCAAMISFGCIREDACVIVEKHRKGPNASK
jgi:hypothetical protein